MAFFWTLANQYTILSCRQILMLPFAEGMKIVIQKEVIVTEEVMNSG